MDELSKERHFCCFSADFLKNLPKFEEND